MLEAGRLTRFWQRGKADGHREGIKDFTDLTTVDLGDVVRTREGLQLPVGIEYALQPHSPGVCVEPAGAEAAAALGVRVEWGDAQPVGLESVEAEADRTFDVD